VVKVVIMTRQKRSSEVEDETSEETKRETCKETSKRNGVYSENNDFQQKNKQCAREGAQKTFTHTHTLTLTSLDGSGSCPV
jgi:tRNA U38,U39,U40 pseudouridine synthase TruA